MKTFLFAKAEKNAISFTHSHVHSLVKSWKNILTLITHFCIESTCKKKLKKNHTSLSLKMLEEKKSQYVRCMIYLFLFISKFTSHFQSVFLVKVSHKCRLEWLSLAVWFPPADWMCHRTACIMHTVHQLSIAKPRLIWTIANLPVRNKNVKLIESREYHRLVLQRSMELNWLPNEVHWEIDIVWVVFLHSGMASRSLLLHVKKR